MTSFRISVTALAVMHAVFTELTALVGAFADGGNASCPKIRTEPEGSDPVLCQNSAFLK